MKRPENPDPATLEAMRRLHAFRVKLLATPAANAQSAAQTKRGDASGPKQESARVH